MTPATAYFILDEIDQAYIELLTTYDEESPLPPEEICTLLLEPLDEAIDAVNRWNLS